ncbi:hypothetical protein FACS189440_21540 [Bacteroidia bacterium]|nr:hypothetical protein FACS189440_21540 [Bacteroidia bacterium]
MKKVFYCISAVVVVALSTWNFNFRLKTESFFSGVVLTNVDALAQGEEVVIECDATCLGRGQCWSFNWFYEGNDEGPYSNIKCSFLGYTWVSCNCS